MSLVYLGLGSNLGDKNINLNSAIRLLSEEIGSFCCQSLFYSSEPWGFMSENSFLNAVALFETKLDPFELLAKIQELESQLGRSSKSIQGYSDRIIDIDILLYDNLVINDTILQIPHLLLTKRDFVLVPLAEIAPDLVHPLFEKTMKELSCELKNN
jgi:2-amino-4-hydroxy-6-hydroxymethyldihydropteridine diphosphokinase